MSDLSQAAGTRENILVVANNSNSQAIAASNITVSGSTSGAGGQQPSSLSTSRMSKVILNSLTPNPVVYTPVTTTSNIIPGISQSSSRSSLCTLRSSTSLLSSTDIDLLMDVHGHPGHHGHHLGHHLQPGHHTMLPPHTLPVIGTPGTFLTEARHSLHISTSSASEGAADSANNNLLQSSSTLPNFASNRLFFDSANSNTNTVKMRNKSSGLNPSASQSQSQSSKMMHLINSDSGLSSMLPSASSSSSLMASSSYLCQPPPNAHHLQHSYSSSSVPSTHTVIRGLNPYAALGMPSSASSISSNSSSMLHPGHHPLASAGNSMSLLIPDYDDYGTTKSRGNLNNQAAIAMMNQYRQSTGGSSNNKIYGAIGSNDARNDYESLYRKYAELDNFHTDVIGKLSMADAEIEKQRKKFDDIIKCNQNLEQQRQMDAREIEQLKVQLDQARKQRDEALNHCNIAISGKTKAIKDLNRMHEENAIAKKEYTLIMSERDSVHKEIDKLQEDLNVIARRNETLEKENKAIHEELESFKRELASALLDRDQAMKMYNEMKQKYGELRQQPIYGTLGHGHHSGHGSGYYTETANSSSSSLIGGPRSCKSPVQMQEQGSGMLWNPRKSLASKGKYFSNHSSSSSVQSSQFGKASPGQHGDASLAGAEETTLPSKGIAGFSASAPSVDQMEALRKQFERLQVEFQEALQEIEVCKKRRDWAFSERDKIVQERESIRTLCDKLRRERDRKVSDLAEALRESDELKKQKNETIKELNELKEKFDLSKGAPEKEPPEKQGKPVHHQTTTNTSIDSAIDLDDSNMVVNGNYFGLPDCELVEVCLKKESVNQEWGFKIKVDDAMDVVITSLLKNASPQLRVHDQLVKVNNIKLATLLTTEPSKLYLAKVESLIRESGTELHLQLRRRRLVRTVQNVCLPTPKMDQMDHPDQSSFLRHFGFDAECALIVNRVDANATTPNKDNTIPLSAGDRIIAINGTSLNNLFGKNLVPFMLQQPVGVQAQVVRFVPNRAEPQQRHQLLASRSSASSQPHADRLSVCVEPSQPVKEMLTPPPPPPPPIYLLEPNIRDLSVPPLPSNSKYFPHSDVSSSSATMPQLPIIMSPRTPKGHPTEIGHKPPDQSISNAVPTGNFYPIISINGTPNGDLNESKTKRLKSAASVQPQNSRHQMPNPPLVLVPAPAVNQLDSSSDEDDAPTFVVDEDNDADADDDSTTTATSDTATEDGNLTDEAAEVKTIAELDKVLEKYQVMDNDYYGSTVTNSSGSSLLLVMPLMPAVQQTPPQVPPASAPMPVVEATYEPIIPLPQSQPKVSPQSVPLPPSQPSQPIAPPSVVRRSSRLSSKKTRSQRCTLAASQLAEAAHELTLALSASAHTGAISSGDTWPRYRPPHQLFSSVLPAFYKHHGQELQQIYSKQGHSAAVQQRSQQQQQPAPILANYDEVTYLTIHHPRRKQRKSLGVFADIFPQADHSESGLASGGSQAMANAVACSTADTLTTAAQPAGQQQQQSTRRSPRLPEMTTPAPPSSQQAEAYAAMDIPFDHHHHSQHSHHLTAHHHPTQQAPAPPPTVPLSHQAHRAMQSTQQAAAAVTAGSPSPAPLGGTVHSASGQPSKSSMFSSGQPQSARASDHFAIVPHGTAHLGPSHHAPQYPGPAVSPQRSHLEPETHKMAALSRNSNYNSIKSKPPANYYAGPNFVAPPPPSVGPSQPSTPQSQSAQSDALAGSYYAAGQAQPSVPPSSYSPIYSTYSSYRAPLKPNSDSSHPSSKSQSQPPPEGMYVYRTMPNGPSGVGGSCADSVDFTVVSAQSQDKSVLSRYKTRQASGSSQTGISPSPATDTPLLIPPYNGHSSAPTGPMAKQPQQQSTRSHLLPEAQACLYGSTGSPGLTTELYSPYGGTDIYGQARLGKSVMANAGDIYGTIARNGQSAVASSYYGNPAAILAAAEAGAASGLPPTSHLTLGQTKCGATPQYGPASSAGHSQNMANRHSMNLGLLSFGSSSGNSASSMLMQSNRDSLILSGVTAGGGPPHYDHHLTHANLEAFGPPGSSKTLPSKHNTNTLLAISANPRASYKEAYAHQSPSVYASSAYDSSHVSSRTSITSSVASTSGVAPVAQLLHGQHNPSYLTENIYGSLLKSVASSQRATPPPPAPVYVSSADEAQMASNFEENICQALNLMGPSAASVGSASSSARMHRFRIPSNSSTVSASRTSSKGTFSGLNLLDKSGSSQSGLPHSTSVSGIYGGSNHGSGIFLPSTTCGDRSSLVSSTGGLPPWEVKVFKCTEDGAPGSPILDLRKAKPDDYRQISIERSSALLGIQILKTNKSKGVFVKTVTKNSLAHLAGIQVGDQIMEICGINMRTADYENAAKVLKQCGDSVQMLVQYQIDKFKEIWNMLTESERCNSMDSVGLSGSSSAQGSGAGTSSSTDQRQSNDSILVNEEELERDNLRRLSRSAVSSATTGATESSHRYSIISDQSSGNSGRTIRRGSSRRSANAIEHDPQSGLVIYHSRHSTLTNDDISSTSATSTLTRRPKVASLPHECSLLSNSPTSTSNEDQSSHSVMTTSASSSQANMNLPYSASSFSSTKDASTTALHGSTALFSSPRKYGQYDHHHHSRQDSQSPPSTGANQGASSGTPPSTNGTTNDTDDQSELQLDAESSEYRHIVIENPSSSLGISLVGGNAIGIFVHQIRDEQLASSGLAPGDQIIEYNGKDLRTSTAEEAAIELAKPADVVKLVVHHNMKKYHEIQETTIGDSFYIKTAFDRPSIDGSLGFHKNQVLYIDNTMYQGVPGVWGAWTVNAIGEKEKFGVIPSKYKAEEELMMKRGAGYDGSNGNSSIGSSTRRSFFRRRKNGSGSGSGPFSTIAGAIHFRSSSRDSTSKEIACYSDLASLRGPPHLSGDGDDTENADTSPPEYPVPQTYIKVKKLNYELPRPVIIIGPLKEMFIDKLEQDFPDVFQRCPADFNVRPYNEEASIHQEVMDSWLEENKLFDARRKGSYFECTTFMCVRKICEHNLHPLLDINQNKAVSRLIANDIHPVVVFLKFKSTKQIKEINRCPNEKLSSKAAKEMYEHSLKIEAELKELINVTIAGNNLSYMCTQIKKHVDQEQQRALWM